MLLNIMLASAGLKKLYIPRQFLYVTLIYLQLTCPSHTSNYFVFT